MYLGIIICIACIQLYTYLFYGILSTCHFCFSRRFILTVTASAVLFRPNVLIYLSLKIINLYNNYYALLCCKAPRTASWKWRSINKIIIIIFIKGKIYEISSDTAPFETRKI